MKHKVKIATLVMALVAVLAGCGGPQPSGPPPNPEAPKRHDTSLSSRNDNADPLYGWVMKFPNEQYPTDKLFYRCDENGLAVYLMMSTDGGLAVVPNSPDCVKR